jgi:4'-phosphopantetheinyl transferase EntD
MIRTLLPAAVAVVEAEPRMWDEDCLLPQEAAQVRRASAGRRREYAAGRAAARAALERLGVGPRPLLRGPDRAPIWPEGTVGSITHCGDYCAAAVAWTTHLHSLGVDAEPNEPLPAGVLERVCTAHERAWSRGQGLDRGIHWPTLIFSAKESIFKAWHPLTGRWLDYLDAEIDVDPQEASFQARLRPSDSPPGDLALMWGRLACDGDRVFTAIAVPVRRQPHRRSCSTDP